MGTPIIQTSFHAGEWAPSLNARVDLAKYHAGAATLRNFFVDYRGGASSRAGTKYVLQCYKSATAVRLIPFQASFTTSYALEFGDQYIRFFSQGSAILEAALPITGATQANPCQLTITAHGYLPGDWIFVTGVVGMTQLNGRYFQIVSVVDANNVTIGIIRDGSNVNSTGYTAYASGGTAARVYTLPSPFLASELALLKFAQSIGIMILCHPNHPPQVLTLISANNWTIRPVLIGSTIPAPTGVTITPPGGNPNNFSYCVTAVDANGQESVPSVVVNSAAAAAGTTLVISWSAVPGAVSYNLYRTMPSNVGVVPTGSAFGFVTNVTGVSFADFIGSGAVPLNSADFGQTIPVGQNPFQGAGVASVTITADGHSLASPVPTCTFATAPSGGVTATGAVTAQVVGTPTLVSNGGAANLVGDICDCLVTPGLSIVVAAQVAGLITAFYPITQTGSVPGSLAGGATIPTNPLLFNNRRSHVTCTVNVSWGVTAVNIIQPGAGYLTPPAITFSAGTAAATAVLATQAAGNPSIPTFFDQRLWMMGPAASPQQFNASQPNAFYNFNITDPVQADNAIAGVLVATKLNTIKGLVGMPTGLIVLSDQQAWLINGGNNGAVPTALNIVANQHAYNGASDPPPITDNMDILYVQAKGSIVRGLTFNFYTQIFTGTDLTVLSNHLFYGFTIKEWARAEEPFKTIWAVRSDGTMLVLTYLKEQELVAWSRHDTLGGAFNSVCALTESVSFGNVDAVYTVVGRSFNNIPVQYIERVAERIFPGGAKDAWCVDAALQYVGGLQTTFSGAEHLAGATVTGLADGLVIPPFIMPASGTFTLGVPAQKVTVGLAITAQLQTLQLDVGEPTIQGQTKKISGVVVRVKETLGAQIGGDSTSLVAMKDLVVGNVSTMLTGQSGQIIFDLVTGDAYSALDSRWSVPGQFLIQQTLPYPITVLGVIPQVTTMQQK